MEPCLPPQPPPDAPAPPPGPEAIRSRRKVILIFVAGSILIVLALGLMAPVVLTSRKATARTEAINNIRQIHLALIDFDADYGGFPDATTIADVRSNTRTTLALGNLSSNDYFRQLLATGAAHNERSFWCKTPATPRSPNNVLGADALKRGECSFAYVAGLSSSSDPETPVVMTPMIPGTFRFDSKAKEFGDKAVVLRIDGSAGPETIKASTGGVVIRGGVDLFDPSLPHWKAKPPDLKWPE